MSTRLESLVEVLKADGTETPESIDALIVEYFTRQGLDEYEVEGTIYEVITERERDDQLYEIATDEADDNKDRILELVMRDRNFALNEMVGALDMDKCIDIVLDNLDADALEEKHKKTFLLENNGYYIYQKD